MISEFFGVLALSSCMFIGCLAAGYIPLSFTLSQRKIQLFTIFGAGLLVGTSLAVIIPEGVETIYGHESHEPHHHEPDEGHEIQKRHADMEEAIAPTPFKSAVAEGELHEHHEHSNNHKIVGISLLLGFVSMLLVDQCSGSHGHSHSPEINLDKLNQSKVGTARPGQSSGKGMTATIGLVVHAAADGIAMGAAASTARSDLQVIVFLAIMLHKAPAAFGLVSFLIHDGLDTRKIKKHLLIFSSAAPVMAIVTFVLLQQFSTAMPSGVNGTGIAMLFSAGTFLYVATVHVLPEVSHQVTSGTHASGLSRFEVLLLVVGCLLPLILNIGHHH